MLKKTSLHHSEYKRDKLNKIIWMDLIDAVFQSYVFVQSFHICCVFEFKREIWGITT